VSEGDEDGWSGYDDDVSDCGSECFGSAEEFQQYQNQFQYQQENQYNLYSSAQQYNPYLSPEQLEAERQEELDRLALNQDQLSNLSSFGHLSETLFSEASGLNNAGTENTANNVSSSSSAHLTDNSHNVSSSSSAHLTDNSHNVSSSSSAHLTHNSLLGNMNNSNNSNVNVGLPAGGAGLGGADDLDDLDWDGDLGDLDDEASETASPTKVKDGNHQAAPGEDEDDSSQKQIANSASRIPERLRQMLGKSRGSKEGAGNGNAASSPAKSNSDSSSNSSSSVSSAPETEMSLKERIKKLKDHPHRLLTALKYVQKIIVVRGNHECEATNMQYGFAAACQWPGGDPQYFWRYNRIFAKLPVIAVVDSAARGQGGRGRPVAKGKVGELSWVGKFLHQIVGHGDRYSTAQIAARMIKRDDPNLRKKREKNDNLNLCPSVRSTGYDLFCAIYY
jgi:hypothetical protein